MFLTKTKLRWQLEALFNHKVYCCPIYISTCVGLHWTQTETRCGTIKIKKKTIEQIQEYWLECVLTCEENVTLHCIHVFKGSRDDKHNENTLTEDFWTCYWTTTWSPKQRTRVTVQYIKPIITVFEPWTSVWQQKQELWPAGSFHLAV